MLADLTHFFSAFWLTFSFSFLVALTGAMSPGPLLTYTIVKAAQTSKRGYLMGLWVIAGHALLELGIIILLLLGFAFILKNILIVRIIGIVGGLILVWFGLAIFRDLYRGNISTEFLPSPDGRQPENNAFAGKSLQNPVIGGILVSMSNPYWWVWWATIGLAFMIQFNISFRQWPQLIAFFLGHEAGDLLWYLLVSTLAFFGLRRMNKKVYYGVLAFCALFMMVFGIYLGVSPFFKPGM